MSRIVAIIQARTGSSRLPGKVLEELVPGRTLLSLQIERLALSEMLSEIMVATSNLPSDDAVAEIARSSGVAVFRGSEGDVLSRYAGAARQSRADILVRICGDSPLHDAEIVDKCLRAFLSAEGSVDLATNMSRETFPYGTSAETLLSELLLHMDQVAKQPNNREHVTQYLYNASAYRIASVEHERDLSCYRWTVDYPEDLSFVRAVYDKLYVSGKPFTWRAAIELLESCPQFLAINAIRNERLGRGSGTAQYRL